MLEKYARLYLNDSFAQTAYLNTVNASIKESAKENPSSWENPAFDCISWNNGSKLWTQFFSNCPIQSPSWT